VAAKDDRSSASPFSTTAHRRVRHLQSLAIAMDHGTAPSCQSVNPSRCQDALRVRSKPFASIPNNARLQPSSPSIKRHWIRINQSFVSVSTGEDHYGCAIAFPSLD
jgi:hypothetical protein